MKAEPVTVKITERNAASNRFAEVLKSGESCSQATPPPEARSRTHSSCADDYTHLAGCKLNYGTFCVRSIV